MLVVFSFFSIYQILVKPQLYLTKILLVFFQFQRTLTMCNSSVAAPDEVEGAGKSNLIDAP